MDLEAKTFRTAKDQRASGTMSSLYMYKKENWNIEQFSYLSKVGKNKVMQSLVLNKYVIRMF